LTLALDFAHALVTQHSRAPRGTRLVGGRVRFRTGVDKWWRLKPIGQVPSPAASDRLGSMTPALGQGGRPERGEKKLYAGHAHRYLPPRPHSAGIDNFLITLTTLTTLTRGGPPLWIFSERRVVGIGSPCCRRPRPTLTIIIIDPPRAIDPPLGGEQLPSQLEGSDQVPGWTLLRNDSPIQG
jgi:hypothetical protein